MSGHLRKRIRTDVRVALAGILEGYTIRRGGLLTAPEEDLPFAVVLTPTDRQQLGASYERDHDVSVQVLLSRKANDTVLDDLDDDAVLVEGALESLLDGLDFVIDHDLVSTETATPDVGSIDLGGMKLTYQVVATAAPGSPAID